MNVSFTPSQVVLNALPVPPLCDTMGHAECEHAASLLVLACQKNGDAWQAMTGEQIGQAFKSEVEAGAEPWVSLNRNPFFGPDFVELVTKGFARWTEDEGCTGPKSPIEFTPKGIEAMRKWVRGP